MVFKIGHKKIVGSGMRKGFKHSNETKVRISVSNKGKEGMAGDKNPMFGKPAWNRGIPRDAETKRRISETKKKNKIHAKEKNVFWKGGIRKKREHYKRVYFPTHPNCHKSGYIAEHRLIMEKHLGRFLDKEEIVHHINEDIHDNRIENLHVFKNKGEHSSHHGKRIFR